MTGGLVLQVVVTGLAVGAAYGLVAIGFVLVHRLTGVLHLAHGDVVGGAVFVAVALAAGTEPTTRAGAGSLRVVAAVVVTIVLAAAFGAALYLVAVRPFFRRRSTIGWIGALVTVAFAIEGALSATFPRSGYVLPDLIPFDRVHPLHLPDGAALPARTLWVLGAGVLVGWFTAWLLRRGRVGLSVAAIVHDPELAELVGVPVQRLVTLGFALAGALAAVAGVLVAPAAPVDPRSGLVLGLKGIAAALLGRLEGPGRVFAAGLGLGVLEGAVASLHVPLLPSLALGPAWRDVAPLLVVLVVVALRGRREVVEGLE